MIGWSWHLRRKPISTRMLNPIERFRFETDYVQDLMQVQRQYARCRGKVSATTSMFSSAKAVVQPGKALFDLGQQCGQMLWGFTITDGVQEVQYTPVKQLKKLFVNASSPSPGCLAAPCRLQVAVVRRKNKLFFSGCKRACTKHALFGAASLQRLERDHQNCFGKYFVF